MNRGDEVRRVTADLDRAMRADRPVARQPPSEEVRAAAMQRVTALAALPVPKLSPEALAQFHIHPTPDADDRGREDAA